MLLAIIFTYYCSSSLHWAGLWFALLCLHSIFQLELESGIFCVHTAIFHTQYNNSFSRIPGIKGLNITLDYCLPNHIPDRRAIFLESNGTELNLHPLFQRASPQRTNIPPQPHVTHMYNPTQCTCGWFFPIFPCPSLPFPLLNLLPVVLVMNNVFSNHCRCLSPFLCG